MVLERDPTLDHRAQGYRLKIEADAAKALEGSLPADVYQAFKTSCAITTVGQTDYNPINGIINNSRAGSGLAGGKGLSASFTVDRGIFRKILMTGISDKITFGKELASYDIIDAEQEVVVSLKDGEKIVGRLLVGADGVRSSVRKTMLPNNKYVDTGAMCIYGKTPLTTELTDSFPSKGLRWMTACVDSAPSIQSILIGSSPLTMLSEPIRFPANSRKQMQLPADYVYWVLIGRKELFATDAAEAAEKSSADYGAAKSVQLSLELTKEWDPSIRSILQLQDASQCSTLPVVSALPEIAPWKPSQFVTLVSHPYE